MYCEAVDNLYVKANGEIPCACSPGEAHPLFRITRKNAGALHLVHRVLNGPELRRARRLLARDRFPFPYCRACGLARRKREEEGAACFTPARGTLRRLHCLQLEASYLCNVDCPYCVPRSERRRVKRPPYHLPAWLARKVVRELREGDVPVRHCAFSGRGEPLMNPRLARLVETVKQGLGCTVSVHTNGNFPFDPALVHAGVDLFSVAVDGTDPETYGRYRRGGNLAQALAFMGDAAAHRNRSRGAYRVIWQYILFDWNSGPEHLERLFALADRLGVDQLLLVETDTPGGERVARDRGFRRSLREHADLLSAARPRLAVHFMPYRTAYRRRPPVDLEVRLRRGGRGASRTRPLLEGRIRNLALEDRAFRVTVESVRPGNTRGRRLGEYVLRLGPFQERVDGVRLEAGGFVDPGGCVRVRVFRKGERKVLVQREVRCGEGPGRARGGRGIPRGDNATGEDAR